MDEITGVNISGNRWAKTGPAQSTPLNISGKTKVVGIIGWPVEHSMSPRMHNAAFAALGLDFVYIPLAVEPQYLPQAVNGLKALGMVGANVTVPYKVAIIPYLDKLDNSVKLTGAANTIVLEPDGAVGYNTDMAGFANSLQKEKVMIAGKQAVLLGAGGAARAVLAGLAINQIAKVSIGARNSRQAKELAMSMTGGCMEAEIEGYDWLSAEFQQELARCDLLVNTTPLGMWPQLATCPPINWRVVKGHTVVYDLVYNPSMSAFLQQAQAHGCKIINGYEMLVEQGRLAFQLWTGHSMPYFG